jgi:hypothetical protein
MSLVSLVRLVIELPHEGPEANAGPGVTVDVIVRVAKNTNVNIKGIALIVWRFIRLVTLLLLILFWPSLVFTIINLTPRRRPDDSGEWRSGDEAAHGEDNPRSGACGAPGPVSLGQLV